MTMLAPEAVTEASVALGNSASNLSRNDLALKEAISLATTMVTPTTALYLLPGGAGSGGADGDGGLIGEGGSGNGGGGADGSIGGI